MDNHPCDQNQPGSGIARDEGGDGGHRRRHHQGNTHAIERAEHPPNNRWFGRVPGRLLPTRQAASALGLALLMAGCTGIGLGPEAPPPAKPISSTTTTETTEFATTTPTEPVTATSTTMDPEPVALISPTGVPLVVTGSSGSAWWVITPCGNEASLSQGTPVGPVDVVLDPGHGGDADIGAVGPNGLAEKEINLRVAKGVEERLVERDISVLLTRTGDYGSPIAERAAFADAVGASLMVSIHHNAPTPGPSPMPGTEVFIQRDSEHSRRLGGLLYEHVVEALSRFDVAWTAAPDAGVMTVINTRGGDAYGIIRRPDTPTALLEVGYISNRAEAELFATREYLEGIADAIAEAIAAYLVTDRPGSGYVEGRTFNPGPGLAGDNCVDPDLG